MKLLEFLLFAVLPLTVVQGQTRITIDLPNVAGFTAPRASLGVQNRTPFKAEIIAMKENLGFIEPGQSVYDQEPVPFEGAPLPVLARIYDWDDKFLGLAKRTLWMRAGQADVWTVNLSEVVWADGSYRQSYGQQTPHPTPDARGELSREIDFPRAYWASSTMVQFGNASLFTLIIKINGVEVRRLESGDVWYWGMKGWTSSPQRSFAVKAVYLDRGRYVGESYTQYIYTAHSHPIAYQFVYGPHDRQ